MCPLTMARLTVRDFNGGAEAMAPHLDKSVDALRHEIAARPGGYKLGLLDAQTIMQVAGDYRILHALAANCGGLFLPLPSVEVSQQGETIEAIARLTREFGDYLTKASEAVADGKVTDNELQRCERELGELVQTAHRLQAILASMNNQAKPAALRAA